MMAQDDQHRRGADLDIVIVNWNSGDLLRSCIGALASSTAAPRVNVMVVDNASYDDSWNLDLSPIQIEIVRNRTNLGFAAACNQGAARGSAPFLLFLNPDTRVAPETLGKALAYLSAPEQARTGVLGIRLVDDSNATQQTCAREPSLGRLIAQHAGLDRLMPGRFVPHFMTDWDHADTREVDQVMGAFLLIRRPLFERIEGFDERYFVYYEDVDLCLSARRAGAKVVHYAGASAWHQGGGTTSQIKDRRLFYMLRSQILYADKWFGRRAAVLALVTSLAVHVPVRTAQALLSLNRREAGEALRAGWLLLRNLPELVSMLGRQNPPRSLLQHVADSDRSPFA
jgi:GT2 family glycosyltransferase